MADPPSYRPVPLEQTRNAVIQQLAMHFAVDNLTAEQLEERLDRAHAATTLDALRAVVGDLPVLAEPVAVRTVVMDAEEFSRVGAEWVPERQVVAGIMGGTERTGVWTPPRSLAAIAIMGGVVLDYREARFGPGVTDVKVLAIMGGVEIVVPPGVNVETSGIALMGGFGSGGSAAAVAAPGAPVLRIGGLALMGGVDVQVRHVGETAGDARRRERLARREAKRLTRGG